MRRMLVFQAGPDSVPRAAVNPEVEWTGEDLVTAEEGCLSLAGVIVDVERPLHARVRAGRPRRSRLPDRGVGARGARPPARDRPPRRRPDPRPDHPRAAPRRAAGAAGGGELRSVDARARRLRERRRRGDGSRGRRGALSAAGRAPRGVYLGTSDFAATVLRALAGSRHQPGAGRHAARSPERGAAGGSAPRPPRRPRGELGIELHQTAERQRARASLAAIRAARPAVGVVCAFGQLIGEPAARRDPPMLNVHPSLLPRWRGAAPIERAIMAGDERTGACVMRADRGARLRARSRCREETEIGPEEDYGSLAARLAEIGAPDPPRRPRRRGGRNARADRAARRGRHLRREDRAARSGGSIRGTRRSTRRAGSAR